MPSSNNLNLPQVATNQNNKEATINDQSGFIDAAIGETLDLDFTSSDVTLTIEQFRETFEFVATNLSVARNLTLVAEKRRFTVNNFAGTNILSVIMGSTTLLIPEGESAEFYADGTTNGLRRLTDDHFEVGNFIIGQPAVGAVVHRQIFTRDVTFRVTLTGSHAQASTAALAQADFDVLKNTVSVGTIRFAASGTIATFIMASATSFAPGDRLEITAPNPQDTNLADIDFMLAALIN